MPSLPRHYNRWTPVCSRNPRTIIDPSARKLVHTERIAIRWGDMDAMGHVNNTVYFRYMEQARVSWYQSLGLNENGRSLPPHSGPVIINTACTFLRALTYPGNVEVQVFIGGPGRSSLMTYYAMRPDSDPQTLYAEGQAKAVWIDMQQQKSIPLPAVLRELLQDRPPGSAG